MIPLSQPPVIVRLFLLQDLPSMSNEWMSFVKRLTNGDSISSLFLPFDLCQDFGFFWFEGSDRLMRTDINHGRHTLLDRRKLDLLNTMTCCKLLPISPVGFWDV